MRRAVKFDCVSVPLGLRQHFARVSPLTTADPTRLGYHRNKPTRPSPANRCNGLRLATSIECDADSEIASSGTIRDDVDQVVARYLLTIALGMRAQPETDSERYQNEDRVTDAKKRLAIATTAFLSAPIHGYILWRSALSQRRKCIKTADFSHTM